jgi:acetyl-CoA acetyltransferase
MRVHTGVANLVLAGGAESMSQAKLYIAPVALGRPEGGGPV